MAVPLTLSQGRCAVWEEPLGPSGVRMRRRPVVDPPAGHVRVRLQAAALNHLDLWVASGTQRVTPPRVIAADGAGVVEASGSPEWAPGDQVVVYPVAACWRCAPCRRGEQAHCTEFAVLGEHADGTACERIQVQAHSLHRRPAGLSWAETAALPLAYLTAWRMLVTRARLSAGETLLVIGGSGAVGTAAILIGRYLGARVLTTSRSDAKAEQLRALGAEHVFSSASGFARSVLDVTDGAAADVVLDHVGGATFDEALRAAAIGGRIVTCGATAGAAAQLNLPRVFVRHLTILGSTTGHSAEFADLIKAAGNGLRPRVDKEFPLSEAPLALAHLEGSDRVGKVVLDCADEA
ncbi:zinc-binding dehydrogenase [Actinoplanes sp. NPDC051346]|uniref:zinc-binding dehydrogenase n=1 Tax=Actinoplanes sp. NPDC051346 TaxID=3155048 RepID=UPI00341BE2AC